MDETRICKECKEEKPLDEFEVYNEGKSRRRTCRTCLVKKPPPAPNLIPASPEHACDWGHSTEELDYLYFVVQKSRCMICGQREPEENERRLALDHDHTCCSRAPACGKCIRFYLCTNCNIGLSPVESFVTAGSPEQMIYLKMCHMIRVGFMSHPAYSFGKI